MANFFDLISNDNEVFRSYVFWSMVLLVKTLLMACLTGYVRVKKMVSANEEDAKKFNSKIKFDDPDVERVRRAHRNDLENIFPFVLVAFFYVLTNPDAWLATNLFRIAAIARIVFTFVYAVYVVPQPARVIAFYVCLICTLYMTLKTLIFFC